MFSEIMKSAYEIDVDMTIINIEKVKKSEWKKLIKYKIQRKLDKIIRAKSIGMKKLRFLKKDLFVNKPYTTSCSLYEVSQIMRLRLKMIKLDSNYGSHGKCQMCKTEE